jgi:hypothetical protein
MGSWTMSLALGLGCDVISTRTIHFGKCVLVTKMYRRLNMVEKQVGTFGSIRKT